MPHRQILFSGTSHPSLAKEICSLSEIPLGKIDRHLFPDGELSIELLETVAGCDTFVLQSLALNPNNYLMELLLIIDALKRGGANSIAVIIPYYAYARQDRIDLPGVSITARLVADLLTAAGATRIITMDLHSEQIEGFFNIPVEHLNSRSLFLPYCAKLNLTNCIVVAPDKGAIKIASNYAKSLRLPLALIDKVRINPHQVEMHLFVGEIKGNTVLMPDDMCTTGGTLVSAARMCTELGANRIIALIGHGLMIDDALKKIEESTIELVIMTDSIPITETVCKHSKIKVISAAPLFTSAVKMVIEANTQ